jgi:SP family galactose:H+ symporter-like MFS transporter
MPATLATAPLPELAAPKIFVQPAFLWKISIIGGLSGILYGYDSGIVAAASPYFNHDFQLSDTGLMANIIVSSLLIGVMIGSLAGGQIADRIGRRVTILYGAIIFIAGSLIAQFAQNTEVLITARFVLGLSIGFTSVTAPVYLSELAPPQSRGKLVGFYQLYFTLGMALSSVVGYLFTSKDTGNWHAMFGVGAIPAAVLFLLVLALPESPRWLFSKGRNDKANAILRSYTSPAGAAFMLEEIQSALRSNVQTTWAALFTKNVRPYLIIASVFLMLLAVTGINAVFYYAATIFKLAGVASTQIDLEMNIILTVINVLGTIVGMLLIDKVGRKPLLYVGLIGMTISLAVLAPAWHHYDTVIAPYNALVAQNPATPPLVDNSIFGKELGPIALTCFIVYIACFAFSLGVIAWVIASELFPIQVRGRGIAAASTAYGLVNFVVTLTFGPLVDAMGGAATFGMYGFFCLATLIFVIFFFPETKGVELEEISKRPPELAA